MPYGFSYIMTYNPRTKSDKYTIYVVFSYWGRVWGSFDFFGCCIGVIQRFKHVPSYHEDHIARPSYTRMSLVSRKLIVLSTKNKEADQPAHPLSPISTFVVRFQESILARRTIRYLQICIVLVSD